jgi:hypothetical protein
MTPKSNYKEEKKKTSVMQNKELKEQSITRKNNTLEIGSSS